jgi:NTE family protein
LPARTPPRRVGRPGGCGRGRRKPINLGLQGGGAHGAFTWGVLDQLLDDGRLEIEGISGASAGAVERVMLADGLARGGADEARQRLADFWRAVSVDGHLPDLQRGVVERLFPFVPARGASGSARCRACCRRMIVNPLNINPLKDVIERFVDFEAIRGPRRARPVRSRPPTSTPGSCVSSTARKSPGGGHGFGLAPLLFRAVDIDGVPYWDGGYSGNPAVIPFLRTTATEDVLIVQINPRERRKVPTNTREIVSRVNEINFNASLLSELRGVAFVNPPHRRRTLAAGNPGGGIPAAQAPSHRDGGSGRHVRAHAARSRPTTNISRRCTSSASARPAASSTSISTTSDAEARSISSTRSRPSWRGLEAHLARAHVRTSRRWRMAGRPGALRRKPSSNLEQQLLQDRLFEIIEAD